MNDFPKSSRQQPHAWKACCERCWRPVASGPGDPCRLVVEATFPPTVIAGARSQGLVRRTPEGWRLTAAGAAWLRRRIAEGSGFQAQHQQRAGRRTAQLDNGTSQSVEVNDAESPLQWLNRRRDKDGQPMISTEQFVAGERLVADVRFLLQLVPRVTSSWSPAGSSVRQGGAGFAGRHARQRHCRPSAGQPGNHRCRTRIRRHPRSMSVVTCRVSPRPSACAVGRSAPASSLAAGAVLPRPPLRHLHRCRGAAIHRLGRRPLGFWRLPAGLRRAVGEGQDTVGFVEATAPARSRPSARLEVIRMRLPAMQASLQPNNPIQPAVGLIHPIGQRRRTHSGRQETRDRGPRGRRRRAQGRSTSSCRRPGATDEVLGMTMTPSWGSSQASATAAGPMACLWAIEVTAALASTDLPPIGV